MFNFLKKQPKDSEKETPTSAAVNDEDIQEKPEMKDLPQDLDDLEQYSKYSENYSPKNLDSKVKFIFKTIGKKATTKILQLYHLCIDKDSPITVKQKSLIIGILGYLILPLDACPDYIPVAGLADDICLISLALNFIIKAVSDKDAMKIITERAEADVNELFKNE